MNFIITDGIKFYQTKYEGYYVSKCGKIISFRTRGCTKLSSISKYLSYKTDRDGYFEVLFSVDKKRYYKKVHQVVAETFLGEPQQGYVVDHIDTNRQNNDITNLRYITVAHNIRRGRVGLKPAIALKVISTLDGVTTEHLSINDCCKFLNISTSSFHRLKSVGFGSRAKYNLVSFKKGVETIEIVLETKIRE